MDRGVLSEGVWASIPNLRFGPGISDFQQRPRVTSHPGPSAIFPAGLRAREAPAAAARAGGGRGARDGPSDSGPFCGLCSPRCLFDVPPRSEFGAQALRHAKGKEGEVSGLAAAGGEW